MVGSPGSSLECPGAMRRLGAMRSLLRGVGCESWLVVVPAGAGVVVVASMDGVPTRHVIVGTMSPCPVEDSCIPGCHDISSIVPVELKRPSAL